MIEHGEIKTVNGRYDIVFAPDLETAWGAVLMMESRGAETLEVGGKVAIRKVPFGTVHERQEQK